MAAWPSVSSYDRSLNATNCYFILISFGHISEMNIPSNGRLPQSLYLNLKNCPFLLSCRSEYHSCERHTDDIAWTDKIQFYISFEGIFKLYWSWNPVVVSFFCLCIHFARIFYTLRLWAKRTQGDVHAFRTTFHVS